MNQIRNPKLVIAIATILCVLSACMASDTNPPVKTPEKGKSSTNSPAPVELESVKAAQAAKTAPRPPKPVAIVLRHVHAIQVPGGQVIIVAPERYLSDLTNLYPSQAIEVLRFEEP